MTKQKSEKKRFFFLGLSILLVVSVLTLINWYFHRETDAVPQSSVPDLAGDTVTQNQISPTSTTAQVDNSSYDPLSNSDELDPAQIKQLTRSQVFTPGLTIFQTFQSHTAITLQVPLYPVPDQTTIDQDPIHGFRVQSDEYDLRLYHVLNLKDARTQCQSFLSEQVNSRLFEGLANYADSPLKDRGAAQFEFTEDGKKVVGTKFCVIETDHNIWAIEVFIENTLFQKKYKSIIWEVVGSFDYSK